MSWTWGKEKFLSIQVDSKTNKQTNKTFIKIKANLLTEKDKSEKEIHRWRKYSQCIYLRKKMLQSIEGKRKSSLKWTSNGMNEYVLKLLFSRKMKIQTRKNCQYKVIRITKMKYIDNTKCWQNCGALGGTQVLSTAPSGNVF